MKVLWIDDDAWAIEGLMLPLTRSQVMVDVAQTYSEALKRLKTENYDGFIVDLILPLGNEVPIEDMDSPYSGLLLIKEIKARYVNTPIIVLSVLAGTKVAEQLAELGVAYILRKPVLPSELRKLLLKVLNGDSKESL